jgi:hypothetical protein
MPGLKIRIKKEPAVKTRERRRLVLAPQKKKSA